MRIYIPTRGRLGLQKTVERLGREICREFKVTIVCPPNEVKSHALDLSAYDVVVLPCKKEGIAATRQSILEHARASGEQVILMLDDDLPTWRKRADGPTPVKYSKATTTEIRDGLRKFDRLMQNYAHGSIGHALMCHLSPPIGYNGRMLRALAYNMELLPNDIKFRLKVMEDFDIALQLMTRGWESLTYNGLVQDQHENNSAGGCSIYRTGEVQEAAAYALHGLWPEYVTVTKRAPKREWIGMGERTDVRINWRRAAKAGAEVRKMKDLIANKSVKIKEKTK